MTREDRVLRVGFRAKRVVHCTSRTAVREVHVFSDCRTIALGRLAMIAFRVFNRTNERMNEHIMKLFLGWVPSLLAIITYVIRECHFKVVVVESPIQRVAFASD